MLTERVIVDRLLSQISAHDLMSKFQSAYRRFHSRETALLRVQNDIFVSLDAGRFTALLLLGLSAAFEIIDHIILLRLQYWFSFSSTALNFLSSFLSGWSQIVLTSKLKSQPDLFEYGVPRSSVLWPLLYSLCTTPLRSVISNHPDFQCHFYADDTQIYS